MAFKKKEAFLKGYVKYLECKILLLQLERDIEERSPLRAYASKRKRIEKDTQSIIEAMNES